MFEPDGWGHRARLGVLVPDGDVGPESELTAMAPDGVSIHAARFRFPTGVVADTEDRIATDPVRYVAAPGPLDEATDTLVHAPVHLVALAFTSTSYVGGEGDDGVLAARLAAHARGRPVVTTGEAILDAVAALGTGRAMLVDPPWFPAELTELGAAWLGRAGVDVTLACPAGIPSGQFNVHPGGLYEWVKGNRPSGTEVVVVGGNGFRAVGAVHALEQDLGIPVVTANTALLWRSLRTLGLQTDSITRYGRLFTTLAPLR